MKKNILVVLAFLACCSEVSCRHSVSGQELMAYMADATHGLSLQKRSGPAELTVQLLPAAYLTLQDMRTGSLYTQLQADSAEKEYAHFYYFRMMIRGVADAAGQSDYFNFGIKEDLSLIKGRDTLSCGICQHIANGNKDVQEYLLAFPADGETMSGSVNLYYWGKTLGLDPLTFSFSRATFRKIPALKI